MTKKKYDVVVPGTYFCDMVFTGLPEVPELGKDVFASDFQMVPGGVYYPVAILNQLGLKVGWKGQFGNDFFSRFMLDTIREEGIDTSLIEVLDRSMRSLAASFSFEHERGFVSYVEAPYLPLTCEDIEKLDTRCLLLPGLENFWMDLPEISRAKNRKNFIIYQECQYNNLTVDSPGLVEALRTVDIFAPNEAEALRLTGCSDVEDALVYLSGFIPLVVIKCGPKGAIAKRGEEVVRVPAIKIDVVDTTGAGDSFNAGFLFAYLADLSLETCLRHGAITGGLSTTGPGLGEIPTWEKLKEMVNEFEKHTVLQ